MRRIAPVLMFLLLLPLRAQVRQRERLETSVLQVLINNPELGRYPLAAYVAPGGTVTLDGVVPTQRDRDQAAQLVKKVPGVKQVKNQVSVDKQVAPLPPTAAAAPAGRARGAGPGLQRRVQRALGADPALRNVTARLSGRVLALTGRVHTKAAKARAGDLARRQGGGMRVDNQIRVESSR